jgi:hypothetical protein
MQHVKETLASIAFILTQWSYCLEPCGRLGLGQSEPLFLLAPLVCYLLSPATETITPGAAALEIPWPRREA